MGDREANSMTITGEHNTDILLDEKGQPVPDENGVLKYYRMMSVGDRT